MSVWVSMQLQNAKYINFVQHTMSQNESSMTWTAFVIAKHALGSDLCNVWQLHFFYCSTSPWLVSIHVIMSAQRGL